MKTKMSKVKGVQELIDTIASCLEDQLTALDGISEDFKKISIDHEGSHCVSPNEHDAPGQGSMQVYVETAIGSKFSVNVKGSDTIQSMKSKINEVKHFPPSQLTLVYRGVALQDSNTLSECNIFQNSTLHMILEILDKDFDIGIISPECEYLDITVRKGFTIWDVKTMIKSRTGTPQQMQKLEYWGRQLDDFLTLAECGIASGYKHIFDLSISGQVMRQIEILSIQIYPDSKPKYYTVYSTENVINLKKKIEEEEGIGSDKLYLSLPRIRLEDGVPPASHRCQFAGELLEDYRTFEDYKVEDGSIIYIFPVPWR